jgi:uncharacterized OB-fold protein
MVQSQSCDEDEMMHEDAPLPAPGPESAPYWAGLREGRLLIQKCIACGRLRHYPRPVCDACFSMQFDWIEASGRGSIHSWTRTHHAFLPVFKPDLPYVLVTVDLEEGPRMNARLRGDGQDPAIGAPVICRFEVYDDNWTFPTFILA